jgi:hypothetical protein
MTGSSFVTTGSSSWTVDVKSPVPTQCDGISRFTVVEKSLSTYIKGYEATLFDIPGLPGTIPNPEATHPPVPSCTIRPVDCESQYEQLINTPGNRTDGVDYPKVYAARFHLEEMENFFGGCGVPEKWCKAVGNASDYHPPWWPPQMEQSAYEEMVESETLGKVLSDRLRLIYFPPEGVVARNICADNFFGTNQIQIPTAVKNVESVAVTATLDEVVFDEYMVEQKSTLVSFDRLCSKLTLLLTAYLSRSTMTAPSGTPWTFTSP